MVLASSEGHSANFVAVFEELLTHVTTCVPGVEPSQLVHADIVFFETRHGELLTKHTCPKVVA